MTLDSNTVLAFLSGSLVTLILKSIIDFINKKIEFNREFKRQFFEKKLEAADKAVANIYSMASLIGTISASYEMMANPLKEFNHEVFKMIVTNANARLQKLDELSINMNSIYLYTNIDENLNWTANDDKLLLDNFSNLKAQDANLLDAVEAYEFSVKHENIKEQNKIWEDVEKLALIYKETMKLGSVMLNKYKLSLMEQRKRLRSEFSKYDKS